MPRVPPNNTQQLRLTSFYTTSACQDTICYATYCKSSDNYPGICKAPDKGHRRQFVPTNFANAVNEPGAQLSLSVLFRFSPFQCFTSPLQFFHAAQFIICCNTHRSIYFFHLHCDWPNYLDKSCILI